MCGTFFFAKVHFENTANFGDVYNNRLEKTLAVWYTKHVINMKKGKTMFNKLFSGRRKDPNSKKYKLEMAEHLNGMSLKCVTEKKDGVEEVVGRSGSITVREGELIVYSSMDVVFRCNVTKLSVWELMSLDGAVITAPDLEHDGVVRTVTVHYTYWRQLER